MSYFSVLFVLIVLFECKGTVLSSAGHKCLLTARFEVESLFYKGCIFDKVLKKKVLTPRGSNQNVKFAPVLKEEGSQRKGEC